MKKIGLTKVQALTMIGQVDKELPWHQWTTMTEVEKQSFVSRMSAAIASEIHFRSDQLSETAAEVAGVGAIVWFISTALVDIHTTGGSLVVLPAVGSMVGAWIARYIDMACFF